MLKKQFGNIAWDDNGNVGKRYRRQDEIGTPSCVTIDFKTLEGETKDTVTVRDRDTGAHLPAHRAHGRTFVALLGLTLLNPATIIYFAALTVGLPFLSDVGERLAFAGAAFVASLSWQSLLALFGAALGRGAGHRLRLPTALLGNVIVIALGLLILSGTLTPATAS